jgi:hypothetical protein
MYCWVGWRVEVKSGKLQGTLWRSAQFASWKQPPQLRGSRSTGGRLPERPSLAANMLRCMIRAATCAFDSLPHCSALTVLLRESR